MLTVSLAVLDGRGHEDAPAETTWVSIVYFADEAHEVAEQIEKGTEVFARGRLDLRHWTDQDGSERWGLSCAAEVLQPLGLSKRLAWGPARPAAPARRRNPWGDSAPTTADDDRRLMG
jgi:single-stranded DNA-binding protein